MKPLAIPICLALAGLVGGCATSPAQAAPPTIPEALDADLTGYPYPYEVRFHEVEDQKTRYRIAYMDVPPTGPPNGHAVLLLHGKNFSGAYWGDTAKSLAAAGFRVIIPDQLGFGRSSKPERFQYSFQALATQTASLLEAVGVSRVAVVGHSMGGMLAARFALMFPQRAERLVLVNPIGLEDWKRWVPYLTVDQWYEAERAKTPESVRAYMAGAYFDGKWMPAYDALAALQEGWIRGPDRDRIAWVSALTYDMIFTQPVVYELADIEVPTLLIIGQRDRTAIGRDRAPEAVREKLGDYPALGRAAASAIPGAKLVALDGVGHIPQVEAWGRYDAALKGFLLDEVPPARR